LVGAALGNLSYGKFVATAAAGMILFVGVSAALSHLGIAPAIVNGIFYAVLATLVGVAIVAVGGGGIQPMRQRWEQALGKVGEEAPKIREAAQGSAERIQHQRTAAQPGADGKSWADEVEDQREVAEPRRENKSDDLQRRPMSDWASFSLHGPLRRVRSRDPEAMHDRISERRGTVRCVRVQSLTIWLLQPNETWGVIVGACLRNHMK
jgi:Flp pilus assembly pilin Flp